MTTPLDGVSSVKAAYSTRKLLSAYAGSCVQLRGVSPTTTGDIGFDAGTGFLDTAAVTTFNAAHGGGHTVSIWYDQSGNANNITPGTAIPTVTSSGINSKPSIVFPGTEGFLITSLAQTQSYTCLAVVSPTSVSGVQTILNGDDGASGRLSQYLRLNAAALETIAFTGPVTLSHPTTVTTAAHVVSSILNGAVGSNNLTNYIDGVAATTTSVASPQAGISTHLDIGIFASGTQPFNGNISEVILIGAFDTASRTAIETDELFVFLNIGSGPVTTFLMGAICL